ncbi:MAG: phosphoheptose isomerase [Candidatus Cloacimonadota bacterium]|nr:MAG: phosphoheptose isomerase [Candidatus Cloacimonadota bacterium]
MKEKIKKSLQEARETLEYFIAEDQNIIVIEKIARQIAETFEKGNKVLICGNGGSLADATHFAEEFTGKFRDERKPLPVIALNDAAHITCTANDFGFEHIFERSVEAFGKPNDVLIVLSTSGNSKNILLAVQKAKKIGMRTVALLGKNGGKTAGKCELELIVNGQFSDRIQEIHMMTLHIIIEIVERLLFPENYQ